MENKALLQLVERIMNAPNNDARIQELMNFAPESLLHRAGLTHRSSMLESTLSITGAISVGMILGASGAMMLVPGARKELRARLRKSLDRLDHDTVASAGGVVDTTATKVDPKRDPKDHSVSPKAQLTRDPMGDPASDPMGDPKHSKQEPHLDPKSDPRDELKAHPMRDPSTSLTGRSDRQTTGSPTNHG